MYLYNNTTNCARFVKKKCKKPCKPCKPCIPPPDFCCNPCDRYCYPTGCCAPIRECEFIYKNQLDYTFCNSVKKYCSSVCCNSSCRC